jgi:uncharacterized membrane protein
MDGPYFMDAVITAHRSLSQRGFIILIGALTAINTASAAFFLYLGAGPVPIFLGLDVAAVAIAFSASRRAALRQERIQVTSAEVRVTISSPRGDRTVWVSPTAFTRVVLAGRAGAEDDVRVELSDRWLGLARALTRAERLEFAKALDRAIWQARSARRCA